MDLQRGKKSATQKTKFVFGMVENIMGKGENAGHQHFLLFQQCFLFHMEFLFFKFTFILPSANALNLDQYRDLSLGKEIKRVSE